MGATTCVQDRSVFRHAAEKRRGREAGAIAIMSVGAVILILCFFGLAVDLSMVYNRKVEMQNVVDTVALAAALELNGTDQGITAALAKASQRFNITETGVLSYQYGKKGMTWSDNVLQFGATPRGPWRNASETVGMAEGLMYVKADTNGFDLSVSSVGTVFMRFFDRRTASLAGARAIAGRSSLKITPLGICAMRTDARRNRAGELEEYGFRRGVAYDLMQLSLSSSSTQGQTFLIHPQADTAADTSTAAVAPYVCSGTIDYVRLSGGTLAVTPTFPIANLYYYFNSRFDQYTAPTAACKPASAPPDVNIKQYTFNVTGGVAWMNPAPTRQDAAPSDADGKRWTVAGPDAVPGGTTAGMFGALWSYAKAAKYASYTELGSTEPSSGYATFGTDDWTTLYAPSAGPAPVASGYPTTEAEPTPYMSTSSAFFRRPGRAAVRGRRVLNIPLLSCPVSGNQASVLGIGKFFMTVQASSTKLIGEFGGLAREDSLGTRVELYP